MPTPPTPWIARVYQECRAGNLTHTAKDVLLTLRTYRGHGGLAWPAHATLADRAGCCVRTVQRALEAAQGLGLVRWSERRVRVGWRSLRTSNLYRFLQPATPVERLPRTTGQTVRGEERKVKQEAREGDPSALTAMLATAERMPDLLAARRRAWAAGLVRA